MTYLHIPVDWHTVDIAGAESSPVDQLATR